MSKYTPKQHGCPYRTLNGKCTHKARNLWKTKRKKLCGYPKPEYCEMYCEWVELMDVAKLEESSILTPLKSIREPSDTRGEKK